MPNPVTLVFALMFVFLTGCEPGTGSRSSVLGPEVRMPLKIGDVEFEAQIALKQEEQRKGLMNRDHLPEDSGMLFPYTAPGQLSFWMASTRIPLDIGFFNESGRLVEIHHMVPFDTSRTRSSNTEIKYALEMNDGWFARNGIRPGQALDLELLKQAILQRGGEPRAYGL